MSNRLGVKNIKWDKTELTRLYWDEKMSSRQIADKLGVTGSAVRLAMQRLGIKKRSLSESLSGDKHYRWQGGKSKTSTGYIEVYMPEHPKANKRKRVYEHILVWEATHNRKLRKGEIVHHLNGIKTDNTPENLIAMIDKKHIRWIPILQKHIRQLEAEIKRCSQTVMELKIW